MKARAIRTPHLTAVHGEVADRQHAGSYAGMAHFAATGPLGMTCGGCCSYGTADASIRNAAGEIIQTRRKPHACGKFQEISGKLGGDIPEHADACKYFEPKESAQ